METQELQAREKREATNPAEQTKAGVVFTPPVDIFETPSEITVLADMPGVNAEHLTVGLHDNVLTLTGDVESPEERDHGGQDSIRGGGVLQLEVACAATTARTAGHAR